MLNTLSCAIVVLFQPIYEENNRKCLFGGTHEQYLQCKAERRAQAYSPNPIGTIAIVAVPTIIDVAGSMTVLSIGDWRKRRKQPVKSIPD